QHVCRRTEIQVDVETPCHLVTGPPVALPLALCVARDRDLDRSVADPPRHRRRSRHPLPVTVDQVVEPTCLPVVGEHGHTGDAPARIVREDTTDFMPRKVVPSPYNTL